MQAKDKQAHRAGFVFEPHHAQQGQVEQGEDAAIQGDQAPAFAGQWAAPVLQVKPQRHATGY